jgi:hypothetical protein
MKKMMTMMKVKSGKNYYKKGQIMTAKYEVCYKIVVNSPLNTPMGKNTDREIHKTQVVAGNTKTAEKRAVEQQKNMFNRTIRIFGTPIKLEE